MKRINDMIFIKIVLLLLPILDFTTGIQKILLQFPIHPLLNGLLIDL